jgi:hypothetical protein
MVFRSTAKLRTTGNEDLREVVTKPLLFYCDASSGDRQPIPAKKPNGRGVYFMFDLENSFGKGITRVIVSYGYGLLDYYGAMIKILIDKVHGGSTYLYAVIDSLPLGIQSRKGW